MQPAASVLMAAWNAAPGVALALDSILGQTVGDIEVVVVDDGSTDATPTILERVAARDGRVHVISLPRNVGLASALNRGLAACGAEIVIRMDADDVALPDRLERQLAFLEDHRDVGLLGTQAILIDQEGKALRLFKRPISPSAVLWYSLLENPFIHPTVAVRRSLVERIGGYREDLRSAQDYDFFHRLLEITAGANLPEPLLLYRRQPGGTTDARRAEQLENHRRISDERMSVVLGEPFRNQELELLRRVFVSPEFGAASTLDRVRACWLYGRMGVAFRHATNCHGAERRMLNRLIARRTAIALVAPLLFPPEKTCES